MQNLTERLIVRKSDHAFSPEGIQIEIRPMPCLVSQFAPLADHELAIGCMVLDCNTTTYRHSVLAVRFHAQG